MGRSRFTELPQGRVVVVSPHLDDGVLSLGAAIAAATGRGTRVEVLTVLALDPTSPAASGGWDARGGFRTEADAAQGRREEDAAACGVLRARPVWLPFGSVDFERHGDEDEVREAVTSATAGADAVVLPGFPLSHPDHEWLTNTLLHLRSARRGFYAEQPYAARWGRERAEAVSALEERLGERLVFEPVASGPRDRFAKWRAIRRYRSQLPLLGMRRSLTRGAHAVAWGGEAIAWERGEATRAAGRA